MMPIFLISVVIGGSGLNDAGSGRCGVSPHGGEGAYLRAAMSLPLHTPCVARLFRQSLNTPRK